MTDRRDEFDPTNEPLEQDLTELERSLADALRAGDAPAGLGDRAFEASIAHALETDPSLVELQAKLAVALAAPAAVPAGLTDRIAAATIGEPAEHSIIGRIGLHRWSARLALAATVALVGAVVWVSIQTTPTVQPGGTPRGPVAVDRDVDRMVAMVTEFLDSNSDQPVDADMLAMSVELDEYEMNWESLGGGPDDFDDTARLLNDPHVIETSFESYR